MIIFVVDASGSTALARLAEAKGAVELLLGQAYARRDQIALVAFRGEGAELLLPQTRSLVRAKRSLAALPGGGATPVAAGLKAAQEQAHAARSRGVSPSLVVMTDGKANIALNAAANRAEAKEDALKMARLIAHDAMPAVVIDTGNRPSPAAADLAAALDATYLPLPRADARGVSAAVLDSLGAQA